MSGGRRASINLEPGPGSVGVARRGLAATLRRWAVDDELIERAVLVASELVTNAVLHAGGAMSVRAEMEWPGVLRIEVLDRGTGVPSPRRYGAEASTGRGLALVETISASWGVEERTDTKIVWAVVASDDASMPKGPVTGRPATSGDPRDLPDTTGHVVLLLRDVPVATFLDMQSHHDTLLRELDLLAFRIDDDDPAQPDMPVRLREMVVRSRRRFARPRDTFARQIADARSRGASTVELRERFPRSAALELQRYVTLLEEAEDYARKGLLLAVDPTAAAVRLRRWLVAEATGQLEEGRPPRPMTT